MPASLWVFLFAFGAHVSPIDLLVAYGLANILAVIPITPGGLGVVEFISISTLTGFGVAGGAATAGVLCWRLVNFWLPIPFGGVSYLTLWRNRKRLAASLAPELELRASSTASSDGTAASNGTGPQHRHWHCDSHGHHGHQRQRLTAARAKLGDTGAGLPDTDALPPGLVN